MSAIIDWENCVTLAGNNPELAKDILTMLVDELPSTTQELQTALERSDYEQMLHFSHRLHGAASYCGVPILKNAAKELEQYLKHTTEPSNVALKPMLESLTTSINDVNDAYKKLFDAK